MRAFILKMKRQCLIGDDDRALNLKKIGKKQENMGRRIAQKRKHGEGETKGSHHPNGFD